jgi:hypothetical protein
MLAGAASFALVASAQPAAAADGQTYVMMLQMPTGAVEHIQYTGDVPPQIVLSAPVWEPSFATSYATLARMTAILEEQEAAQEAAMARLATATPAAATFENLPAGAVTYISTYVSDGACTRTTQITYSSEGVAPRTVSDTSGDRGAAPAARAPAEVRLPAAHHHTAPSARLIEARANGAHLAPGLLHEAVWRP